MSSIAIAITSKTIQEIRGVSLVDASTSERLSKETQVCHVLVPRMIPHPSDIKDQTALASLIARIAFTCLLFMLDRVFRSSVT